MTGIKTISLSEMVEQIRKAKGCSQRAARRLAAKHIKSGKIQTYGVPSDMPKEAGQRRLEAALETGAAERFKIDPSTVMRFNFDKEQVKTQHQPPFTGSPEGMERPLLTVDQAEKLFREGATDEMFMDLPEIMRAFGLTEEELKEEVRSCRLRLVGERTDYGYRNVAASVAQIVEWMVLTKRTLIKRQ
jgi:hypothetical protein